MGLTLPPQCCSVVMVHYRHKCISRHSSPSPYGGWVGGDCLWEEEQCMTLLTQTGYSESGPDLLLSYTVGLKRNNHMFWIKRDDGAAGAKRREINNSSLVGWHMVLMPAGEQISVSSRPTERLYMKRLQNKKSKGHLAQLKMTVRKGPAGPAAVSKRHLKYGASTSTLLAGEFPCRRAPLLFVFFLFPFRQGFSV